MKRLLAIGIILLFIGMTISSSTGFNLEKQSTIATLYGNTLYVGGNGTGNYTKIQDAIDDASDGDTVFVYNGTYYENVIVNKSINLVGEDKEITIIDGSNRTQSGIYIIGNNITVTNFKIHNCYYAGIHLKSSQDCKIKENIIDSNQFGIDIYFSSNITIFKNILDTNYYGFKAYMSSCILFSNNTVLNNFYSGLDFSITNDSTISNNLIMHNGDGIKVSFCRGPTNKIFKNNIIMNSIDGIYCIDSDNLLIRENNISYNEYNGISCVFYCNYSQILCNVIEGNDGFGIRFLGFNTSYFGNISGNLIIDNNYSGIQLVDSNYYSISENHIENNNVSGLEIFDSDNNNISWNIISNNNEYGVRIFDAHNNTFHHNLIRKHKKTGLKLQYSNYNQIMNNNFISNHFEASFLLSNYNKWIGNYWNRPRLLPKPIFGKINFIFYPWIQFDWHPAQEPYDIGV